MGQNHFTNKNKLPDRIRVMRQLSIECLQNIMPLTNINSLIEFFIISNASKKHFHLLFHVSNNTALLKIVLSNSLSLFRKAFFSSVVKKSVHLESIFPERCLTKMAIPLLYG